MIPARRDQRTYPAATGDLIRRELDRMFSGWPRALEEETDLTGAYPVDMWEDDEKLHVEAELPGFDKEDISVTIETGVLSIEAERPAREDTGTAHVKERRYTRVSRQFTLPRGVKESDVDATYDNGVLRLELDKKEEARPRRIKVM